MSMYKRHLAMERERERERQRSITILTMMFLMHDLWALIRFGQNSFARAMIDSCF